MDIQHILLPLGLAVTLSVIIPAVLFPVFYLLVSPSLGCTPVGNAQNLFSTKVFQGPQVEATCPPHDPGVYLAILIYISMIAVVMSIFIFSINKGSVIIIAGAFLPSIYFGSAGMGMIPQGGQQLINMIGVIIISIGVIASWMMK